MGLTERERRNWLYLVAAVQNPQGSYVNARAGRYAEAIVAVSRYLDVIESQNKVHSISAGIMVLPHHETARNDVE